MKNVNTVFWQLIGISAIFFLMTSNTTAHDKVVVVPLGGEKTTGNATPEDVLKDKTFSNSSATGLAGTRPPAPVQRTGQSTSYYPGDDYYHYQGVSSPLPRFVEGAFHVFDKLTGLMWEKSTSSGLLSWSYAVKYCNDLSKWIGPEGDGFGFNADDWRMPNLRELQSLINYKYNVPALSNTWGVGHWQESDPFTGVKSSSNYWSSTTFQGNTSQAWNVSFEDGDLGHGLKGNTTYVLCVRSP